MAIEFVNIWAVLVSAIVAFAIGAIWYSPLMFADVWMKLVGLTKKDMAEGQKKGYAHHYTVGFISQLAGAFTIAVVIAFVNPSTVWTGLAVGLLLWLGMIASSYVEAVLWEKKEWKHYFINTMYRLVTFLVISLILTVWP